MEVSAVVFTLSLLLLLGLFVGYPVILFIVTRGKREITALRNSNNPPNISVIIPTILGEKVIAKKLDNLFLGYPKEKMEVIIVDSSKKGVRPRPNITIVKQPRMGKAQAINLGLQLAKNDIVIITDEDTLLRKDSILNAVNLLQKSRIGGVMADVELKGEGIISRFFLAYYQIFRRNLRVLESMLDTTPHACGEFFAFKKFLVDSVNPQVLCDDLHIVFKIRRANFRAIVSRSVYAVEDYSPTIKAQIGKVRRTTVGTLQVFKQNLKILFNPRFGTFGLVIAPVYMAKLLLTPFLLISIEVCLLNFLLNNYVVSLAFFLLIVSLLLISKRLMMALFYTFVMQVAVLLGMLDFLLGNYSPVWSKKSK